MKNRLCLALVVLLLCVCGCGNIGGADSTEGDGMNKNNEDVICGGTTDTSDYNASKVIESDNLVSLSVGFYHEKKNDRSEGMYYTFSLEPGDGGKTVLKVGSADGFEVDESVLDGAQAILRKYEMEKVNGIHKTTAGLPPEYEACYLEAKYDSGETISFSENSDPSADWSGELLEYFAGIMADNGDDSYLVPKISGVITRFSMEILNDNMSYSSDTISVPIDRTNLDIEDIATNGIAEDNQKNMIYKSTMDIVNDDTDKMICVDQEPEYYEGLLEIISDMEIRDYENYNSFSDIDENMDPMAYYNFYIEFEDGSIMAGTSSTYEEFLEFKPLGDRLMEYIDNYFDTHQATEME